MKTYDEKEVVHIQRTIKDILCDKCGKPVERIGIYDHRELHVCFRTGSSYPEGGSGTQWEVEDLCDKCVGDLRQLLEANGFKVADSEWDW